MRTLAKHELNTIFGGMKPPVKPENLTQEGLDKFKEDQRRFDEMLRSGKPINSAPIKKKIEL